MGRDWGCPLESMSRSRSSRGEEDRAGLRGEVGSREEIDIRCCSVEGSSEDVTSVTITITFFIRCREGGGERGREKEHTITVYMHAHTVQ